ncbi:MAG: hypothetical protein KKF24_16435 [Gammaproteobacteria bacterium]|nr:hypothetical protein [Gammaproteobacteria bacterium]MBU1834274.1 hypothetical protein [Gammaproteobacteria bacterium]
MRNSTGLMAALGALGMSVSGHNIKILDRGHHGSWPSPHAPATDYRGRSFPKGKGYRVGAAAQKRAAKTRRNICANASKRKGIATS